MDTENTEENKDSPIAIALQMNLAILKRAIEEEVRPSLAKAMYASLQCMSAGIDSMAKTINTQRETIERLIQQIDNQT
jgi:hypothetical protein